MRDPEECDRLYARKPTVIDSPEFGTCKDCGSSGSQAGARIRI